MLSAKFTNPLSEVRYKGRKTIERLTRNLNKYSEKALVSIVKNVAKCAYFLLDTMCETGGAILDCKRINDRMDGFVKNIAELPTPVEDEENPVPSPLVEVSLPKVVSPRKPTTKSRKHSVDLDSTDDSSSDSVNRLKNSRAGRKCILNPTRDDAKIIPPVLTDDAKALHITPISGSAAKIDCESTRVASRSSSCPDLVGHIDTKPTNRKIDCESTRVTSQHNSSQSMPCALQKSEIHNGGNVKLIAQLRATSIELLDQFCANPENSLVLKVINNFEEIEKIKLNNSAILQQERESDNDDSTSNSPSSDADSESSISNESIAKNKKGNSRDSPVQTRSHRRKNN